MSEHSNLTKAPTASDDREPLTPGDLLSNTSTAGSIDGHLYPETPGWMSSAPNSPFIAGMSRSNSYFNMHEALDETPSERVTILDLFDNLAIPSKLERWQMNLSAQKNKLAKRQQLIRTTTSSAKDKAVEAWRKRVPTAEEQLAKYRRRMKRSVDDINKRWNETVTIQTREKISFISAVLNIFISGYLLGATPERFYWWYTAQLCYFMPIRLYTYQRKGYHYFLADLCYFVNLLCILSIWAFPQSKRLFISTYCLAYGNNAVAIVMWRNSLVFHSLDKVTSLFIHLMPPVLLHALVHLTPAHIQAEQFPAIFNIKYSAPDSPEHYTLWGMLLWATLPYAVWQLAYHFLITVRRADQIAAGRPTSFTWLRRSYAKTWIGKFVLWLPESLQETAFMLIQYSYALLTIIPCPLWFWYRWASALFLVFVFSWATWNGANYYMDVFGKKFQKELEQLKKEMARVQGSPGIMTPVAGPVDDNGNVINGDRQDHRRDTSLDQIPLLDEKETQQPTSMGVLSAEAESAASDKDHTDTGDNKANTTGIDSGMTHGNGGNASHQRRTNGNSMTGVLDEQS